MFRKIPFLLIYHLSNFDDLTESGFIPKIACANLCKSIHDVIIIVVSSDPLNLETGKEEKEITKN